MEDVLKDQRCSNSMREDIIKVVNLSERDCNERRFEMVRGRPDADCKVVWIGEGEHIGTKAPPPEWTEQTTVKAGRGQQGKKQRKSWWKGKEQVR